MATKELSGPPRTGPLLAKAALGVLPLPGLRRRGPGLPDTGLPTTGLPDTELVLRQVRVEVGHLAAYARVCGFGIRDELPPTYPHVLAFPLVMRLVTDGSFPLSMLGLVHLGNTITQVRPLRLNEAFTLRVRAADLCEHDSGRQFDVIQEASVGGEPVWREVSTYLYKSRPGAGRKADRKPERMDRPTAPEPAAVWRVGDDIGRRYAAVSGDRNPIHLHALTAHAFGFPRAIAHGMWTTARCIAALEGRLPAGCTVDVAFKLPVLLPTKVAFSSEGTTGGGWRFGLHDAGTGKPHLTGSITPA
jgi:acyl dehydratase